MQSTERTKLTRELFIIQKSRLSAVSMLMAVGLSGCMVGPDYKRPDMALPSHYSSGAALAVTHGPTDLDSWWREFRDSVLNDIVLQVTKQNLDIQASDARMAEARAMAREAGTAFLPQGSLDGSSIRQRQSLLSPEGRLASQFPGYSRDQTLTQVDLGASWELDLAGGLHRRARAYQDEAQAADATRMGVRISIAAEAADAYFRIREAQTSITLLRAQINIDQQGVRLIGERVNEGVATERDSDDAQATTAQDQAGLADLRDVLAQQCNRLDVLMGDAAGTDRFHLQASGDETWAIPGIPGDIRPAQLMRRRPDVIAAERQLAASTESIGVAVSQYYPSLSLGGLLGFERLGTGALFESAAFQPALLAGIHWRLFDFGKVDAEVAAARGGRLEALSGYRQTLLRATEDVEDALSTLAKADEQGHEWQHIVDVDTHSEQSIDQSFHAGASSMIEVLRRERDLLIARRASAVIRVDRARATVGVFRALGGGWSPGQAQQVAQLTAPLSSARTSP